MNVNLGQTFSWDAVAGAATYRVTSLTSPGGATIVQLEQPGLSTPLSTLLPSGIVGNSYLLRVEAVDAAGNYGTFSQIQVTVTGLPQPTGLTVI